MYALSVSTGSFSTPKPEVHFLCGGDAVFKPLSTNDPTLCVSYLFQNQACTLVIRLWLQPLFLEVFAP